MFLDTRWPSELALLDENDHQLPADLGWVNLVLNRRRLAAFLAEFSLDKDIRDILALDMIGTTAGLPLTSTGLAEPVPGLITRPFRLWEYVWLYKTLGLASGGLRVLDLGGPAAHLSILAALAGSHVISVDINPEFVRAARECARALNLPALQPRDGDMRDLSQFGDESFDAVISCSVLEHLTASDQEVALREIARVLTPRGLVGLTFDFGQAAPGANENLPPPHEPPSSAAEVLRRYSQGGLFPVGNSFHEDPLPGCLFRDKEVRYTVAALFLAKDPDRPCGIPRCELVGSALGGLAIEDLPYRLNRGIASVNAELERLRGHAASLERAASERLIELQHKHAALNELALQAERRGVELERATAEIAARDERLAILETAASERLILIRQFEAEIAVRDERIAAVERGLAEVQHEQQTLGSSLDTALSDRNEERYRAEVFQAQLARLQQEREILISEHGSLRNRIANFEQESLRLFLSRRYRRH